MPNSDIVIPAVRRDRGRQADAVPGAKPC